MHFVSYLIYIMMNAIGGMQNVTGFHAIIFLPPLSYAEILKVGYLDTLFLKGKSCTGFESRSKL